MMRPLAQEEETSNFLLPNLTIVVEILAFLLILYILRRYAWPPLSKAMADRQAMIAQQSEDARDAAERLKQAEEKYNSALAEARNEGAGIRDQARADAQTIRTELKEQANAEVERIRTRGEEQLASQREQVVRQLRGEIGGLSFQLAERIVGTSLADDEAMRETVDRFLDELDDIPANESERKADERVSSPAAADS